MVDWKEIDYDEVKELLSRGQSRGVLAQDEIVDALDELDLTPRSDR